MANLNNVSNDIDNFAVSNSIECDVDDCKRLIPSDRCLTVLSQNIRSLNANFISFEVLLSRLDFTCDILILTECWMTYVTSIPIIDGYSSYATKINPIQNDGVIVYIKNDLSYSVEELSVTNSNCLLIKVGKCETAILAIYRSPSTPCIEPFLLSLDNNLRKVSGINNVALIGDLNINILPSDDNRISDRYLALTASHGFLPAHSLVTRDISGTCIDHVILRTKKTSLTAVVQSTITDHKTIIWSLNMIQSRKYAYSNFKKVNYEELKKDIDQINFDPIYSSKDPNTSMTLLVNAIKPALDKNSTIVSLPRRKKIIKPWITPGLLKCIRNRDKLHKKAKKYPNNLIINLTYTRYRNFCCRLLKKVKRNFDKALIQEAGSDSKKLWKTIKTISNTYKENSLPKELYTLSSSPQKSANTINEYFVNVGRNLAENIQASSSTNNNNTNRISNAFNSPINSFLLTETDQDEVERHILHLKNDSSPGWDNISNKVLKLNRQTLVPPLTYIFNNCLAQGVFPKYLKRSQIVPIYKTGDRDCIRNYRPISILPSLSKILEKIVNDRLVDYLESNKLLSDHQYGFRRGMSTDDAVSNLVNYVSTKLDEGNKCISLFLDLAKAFDTVSVPILLTKLEHIGIRGTQLKLFQDYMTERYQCVRLGSNISENLSVTHGVPQGSVLGPTLFLIYINDLLSLNSFQCKIISYADDTALIFSAKTWQETFSIAQKGFDDVNKWLRDNVLTLNADKTKYLAFSIRETRELSYNLVAHTCFSSLTCSCKPLERAKTVKYLGIILDDNLSFKKHIEVLSGRTRKLIYFFKTLRHVVDQHLLKRIYFAVCQSILTYCISSWGGAQKTTLKTLEVAQRAILKVCTFKSFYFPTNKLYEMCEVMNIRQLFLLSIVMKQHSSMCFDPTHQEKRRYLTVCDRSLNRTSFADRFFPSLGPSIYNKINQKIQIYYLNRHLCKKATQSWLMTLSYEDTEDLLKVIK